jgi:hypothetical protein
MGCGATYEKVYRPNEREAGTRPGVDIERGREFWIICRKRVPKKFNTRLLNRREI